MAIAVLTALSWDLVFLPPRSNALPLFFALMTLVRDPFWDLAFFSSSWFSFLKILAVLSFSPENFLKWSKASICTSISSNCCIIWCPKASRLLRWNKQEARKKFLFTVFCWCCLNCLNNCLFFFWTFFGFYKASYDFFSQLLSTPEQ